MDTFTTFIQQLDQTLAQSQVTPTTVYVPVTFSWQQQHLQVEMPSLRTSFNQGANAFGVADILDRIRQLVGIELMEKPQSQWPRHATAKALTITIHKVVRVIPVDMQVYGV
ncbi:hypothetical protein [Lactobacillus pentosus] [Lactiplantibacillus mudanjiangensis]|uniref:hypothetical protein n=1 Tax=Lactiplantibacillus mudanjiangensis TaxID=1296538 RepID=UPI0010151C0D|nr:hypothetical protein [Lactiplantibacillus mudanjiangensis]VDG32179.1 hypothetical protein [Lactobacillus pentosus] [Lactiplantibacillus mudanjiangensis]